MPDEFGAWDGRSDPAVTVERGAAWGTSGPLPDDGVVVRSDAEARAVVEPGRRADAPLPALGLLGGDLCRTVGGSGDLDRLHGPDAARLPADLGSVLLDGRQHWFVAHLVARRTWWRGRLVAVMNAEYLGDWDVAPRSHPGDGRFDVVDVAPNFGVRARLQARRRLPHGGHLPHPGIRVERVAAWQTTFDAPLRVWLDGTLVGEARQLSVRVEPDAVLLVV
jgi:hypothetical protein